MDSTPQQPRLGAVVVATHQTLAELEAALAKWNGVLAEDMRRCEEAHARLSEVERRLRERTAELDRVEMSLAQTRGLVLAEERKLEALRAQTNAWNS